MMPPNDVTDTKILFNTLCKEWQDLNTILPSINSADNHETIILQILAIYKTYKVYQEYEQPLHIERLLKSGEKTKNDLADLDEAGLTSLCKLHFWDVLEQLNTLFPLTLTFNIVKNIDPLFKNVFGYLLAPIDRHKQFFDDINIVHVHVASVSLVVKFLDSLSGESANPDQFGAKVADAIIRDPTLQRLDADELQLKELFGQPRAKKTSADVQNLDAETAAQKARREAQDAMIKARTGYKPEDYIGLNAVEAATKRAKEEAAAKRAREDLENTARAIEKREKLVNKLHPQTLIHFANKDVRPNLLYERAFVDWAELLIQQASFYCIKFPLADSFHNRHHVVHAIIIETVKCLNQPLSSTVERMVHLAQFVLQQDIGNGVLFKLLTPALKEVPELERYPFDLYAKDKTGRDALVEQLKTFTQSDRYFHFQTGYESQAVFKDQPEVSEPNKMLIRHKPLEKIVSGEIKMRLHKLPSNILRNSVDTLAPTAIRRFFNWLRGLLTQGKIREQMIQEYKTLNPEVLVTEEGFIKGPPPAA